MNESIGQRLQAERQARDISLEQIAQGTHIRLHYLQAIEADEFDKLPSIVQARGFLRAYASYLGVDPEPFLDDHTQISGSQVKSTTSTPAAEQEISAGSVGEDQEIFEQLGKQLQQQRQLLGLTLEDVERHTHLRVFYLRALESGSLDILPSPVQARGMLNNYATFLGMDPEPILLRFADGLQAQLAGKQATRPIKPSRKRSTSTRSPLRRFLSGEIIVVTFLIVALVSVVAWAAVRVNSIRTGQLPSPTVVSIAEALLPTDAPAIETTPEESIVPTELRPGGAPPATPEIAAEQILTEETETIEETQLPPESQGAVQVNIIVGQRAWMRVIADGEIEYDGRVLPGSAYTFSGDEMVELLTGNGAALQVVFNQQDLGTLGIYGEVVQVIFTPEGILQPTPTITPTGTPAPEPTATPEVIGEP